ncbi:P-loop containing nucleoside triphosphate hydrolase protein [Wallemia mellicola]|uniref:P-loop containing nucleoside triphosphate hydrolase protein n=1 Tax=Wallemia mellicola TaxID=1708541 RepID=A0A4T0MW05_9BASI|nr:hypothetical protein E3Q23_00808 [Wallemia mellicola]TIB81208.1 P-loop containing nucleoside triphosphate hydrolase protein [Wallemia mellicola]TIB88085.1 P-loop containing nucleoside triphosphate hydrolase protein [Wallemia mellicola]TIC32450.1 P-loop containing nucleoside triphosphate hydrolase protein [Wallemia mellicola]TIC33264.1 P-loop containing nucleoside triphosphate hydrolase protein [Wallemia mellicola]
MATLKPPTDKALRRWVSTDTLHSARYSWPFLAKPKSSSNLHAIQTLKLGSRDSVHQESTVDNKQTIASTSRRNPRKKFIKPGQALYKPVNDYVKKFTDLVKLEQQASEIKWNTRLLEWPIERLKQEGYCITDLSGYYTKRMFGKHSAIFQLQPGEQLPSHRFRKGDIVKLSLMNNETEKWSATIESSSSTQLQLLFERKVPINTEDRFRIDYTLNDVSYRRSLDALECLHLDPVEQASSSDNALKGTHLRDLLIEGSTNYDGIFANDCWIRSWASRYSKPNPIRVEGDPILNLNPRQVQAVALMIGNRASLIQGPPGTGKTATISNSINLMKKYFKIPHPILIAAHTNVATDNIASILSKTDLKITRLGHISRIAPELHKDTLVAQVEAHPQYREVKHARIKSEGLFKKAYSMTGLLREQLNEEARKQRREATRITKEIQDKIIKSADVVCATCLGGNPRDLTGIDFPIVFIDEGSQATEPTTLIPLMKGCSHMSIIGDHKQLAPIITSEEASRQGLSMSLFERLIETSDVPSVMLDVQYRMHPDLSEIPNNIFYNSQLIDGCRSSNGTLLSGYTPPHSSFTRKDSALAFVNHDHSETKDGESTMNEGEAQVIMTIIADLFEKNEDLKGTDIGIVSPYIAQTIELLRLINRDYYWRRRFADILGPQRVHELRQIEVKTVDGFEGREKQVIILSLTRSNEMGSIGFLDDPRRANVGLTRAKRCLMVVGNARTLEKGVVNMSKETQLWKELISLCKSKSAYVEHSNVL